LIASVKNAKLVLK